MFCLFVLTIFNKDFHTNQNALLQMNQCTSLSLTVLNSIFQIASFIVIVLLFVATINREYESVITLHLMTCKHMLIIYSSVFKMCSNFVLNIIEALQLTV